MFYMCDVGYIYPFVIIGYLELMPLSIMRVVPSKYSPCHAPSVRGRIVLLIYVVLDCGQLVAWSVVSGGM
jgi:hypothetical protein